MAKEIWFWQKKFESIDNAPKSERPKSASCEKIVSKVNEIVERDYYKVRDKHECLASHYQFITF